MMDQNKLDDTDMTDEELPVFGKTHSLQVIMQHHNILELKTIEHRI